MTLTELVEQLILIQADHPESAELEVRAADLAVFAVHLAHDGDAAFVELELYRPWALQ